MEETILYLLVLPLAFLFIAFKVLKSRKPNKNRNLPPSPPSLPILGHLHLLKHPVHLTLQNLSKTYGPIFSLRFGSCFVVIISSPSAVQECFTKNDIILSNRPQPDTSKYITYNGTMMAQAPYGDHWRNSRRLCSLELLSTKCLNISQSIRRDEVKKLVMKLLTTANSGDGNNFVKVELKTLLYDLLINVTMRMIAGKAYFGDATNNEEEGRMLKELVREILECTESASATEFLPFLGWLGWKLEKKMKEIGERADKLFQGLLDERRNISKRKGTSLESDDVMIDHLLSLQELEPQYYTDETIKGLIMSLVVAGMDTSAITLEWAMSNLLNHPNILKELQDEIDSQIGDERLMDEPDLPKLPFLQNVISETLRLYPPAPLLIPRKASSDCTITNYFVPKGTMVICNAWAMHRDPENWTDPTSFRPERFQSLEDANYKYLPFGLGRRACPGVGLAHRVLGLTLGTLIQCFEWKRVSGGKIDMAEGKGLSMPKAKPLEALCKPRPIMRKSSD